MRVSISKNLGFGVVLLLQGCISTAVDTKTPSYEPAMPQEVVVKRVNNGAIYQAGMTVGLFSDHSARSVGDILYIELVESASSSASSSTKTKKESKADIKPPVIADDKVENNGKEILNNQYDGGRDFAGSGDSSQSHSFNGNIAVTVAEVLPNGNMVVRGQKLIVLNQGQEFIRFSGIVRAEDIRPNNSVPSNRVANAFIAYGDSGVLASANTMGPLNKFFQSPAFPY
jgi:flagellar L-ring protein precursor FlgH